MPIKRILALLVGAIVGGLSVQGLLRVTALPLGPGGVLGSIIAVLVGAALLWKLGHRWFAGGVGAGAVLWSALVLLVVYEFAKGMARFD
jgi:hypothetical protein